MRKLFCLLLALAIVSFSVNAYAVMTPTMANVKAAAGDSNIGRDLIDIVVRYAADHTGNIDGGLAIAQVSGAAVPTASEGAVVVWATHANAILGRDVTVTSAMDCTLVAGIIVESGGIASGEFGRMRIYGYFDDVIAADSTDAIAQATILGTSRLPGQVGAIADATDGGSSRVGVSLEAGSGSDAAEIEVLINVSN